MPEVVGSSFGTLLRQYRRAAHLTQEALAERALISARSVSDLERGLSRMPHTDTIMALAQALSLTGTQRADFLAAAHPPSEQRSGRLEHPALPVALNALVAREREEAVLLHLLQRESIRFVTVTGPAGVGKTRLAFQVALSAQEYFTDGVVAVFLEAIREPELVLPAMAQALKLSEKRQKNVLDTLVAALREQHMLFILDNCEQVLAAAEPLLTLLASCPGLKILTTSRARWRLRGEHIFPLAPLHVPTLPFTGLPEQCEQYGSVALFLQCVRAIQPDFQLTGQQVSIVAELCVRLDGLPLAIELAASRFPLFAPSQLLQRIGNTDLSGLLQMIRGRLSNSPDRHQSLRLAITWSYELLDSAEQALFCALALFEGDIVLDAILAVCMPAEMTEERCLEILETLLAHSLLQRIAQDEPRFRMLQTVRAYGLEKLRERDEEVRQRKAQAAYMLKLVKNATQRLTGPEQAQALSLLGNEKDNIRSVLRWLTEEHELESSLQLVGEFWRYWFLQGALSEGRTWLERLLSEADEGHDIEKLTLARVCYGAGVLATEQGHYERALVLGRKSSQIAAELGEQLIEAQALTLQGNIARYQGAFAQAARYFEEGLTLFRALQQPANIAVCLNNLATLAQERGDYLYARQLQEESLTIKRQQGNQHGIAVTLINLGDIARDLGELAEARLRAEESLRICESLEYEKGRALALHNLGEVACLQGEYAQAASWIEESLKLASQMGDQQGVALALYSMARLANARNERAQAYHLYMQSLAFYLQEESESSMIECLEGCVAVLTDQEPELSARLAGLTTHWRKRTYTPLPLIEAPALGEARRALQARLGKERFAQIFAEGERALLKDEARMLCTKGAARPTLDL